MAQTVNFLPTSINIGVTEPGATNTGATQCAPVTAAANVKASLTNDTSNGALTIVVATYVREIIAPQPPQPPEPSGGGISYYFSYTPVPPQAPSPELLSVPIWKPSPLEWGARLISESDGTVPLPVAAGEFVQVTVRFAPNDSTPALPTATLLIDGDTWDSVAIPISAAVGELRVSVPPISVNQNGSTSVEVEVTLVAGNATTATLILGSGASPEAANVTASLSSTLLDFMSAGQTVSTTLSVSASSNIPGATYIWYLSVHAFNNTYSFTVSVPITVLGYEQSQFYWTQADRYGWAKLYGATNSQTHNFATENEWMDYKSPWGAGRILDAVVTQTVGGFPVNTILVVSDAGVWQVTEDGHATVVGDFSPSSFTSILEVGGIVFIAGGTDGGDGVGDAHVHAYLPAPARLFHTNWQWVKLATPGMTGVHDMCVTPSGQLLLATNNGVWTGTPSRVSVLEWTWAFLQATGSTDTGPTGNPDPGVTEVAFTTVAAFPGDTGFPQSAVAADANGNVHSVEVNADGTATLTPILTNDKYLHPPAAPAYVTIDAADKNTIYASQVDNTNQVGALVKGPNRGQTWSNLGAPGVVKSRGCPVGAYGNLIIAGGERWKISWKPGTWHFYEDLDPVTNVWGGPHAHDDTNKIRFYPINGIPTLLMCTDGGLATTPAPNLAAGMTTWKSGYNMRLTNLEVKTLSMSVDNYSTGATNRGYLVAAATQDNAVSICLMPPTGQGFWTQIRQGDGQLCAYIPAPGVQLPPSVETQQPGGVSQLLATDTDGYTSSTTPRFFIDGGANGPASPASPSNAYQYDLKYDSIGLPPGLSAANAQLIGLIFDGIASPQTWFSDSPRVAYGVAGGLLQDNAAMPTQYGNFAFIVSGDPDGTHLLMTPLARIQGDGNLIAIFSSDATQLFVCMGDGSVWQLGAGLPRASYPPGQALQETTVPTSFDLGTSPLAKFAMTADGTLYMCASSSPLSNGYVLKRDPTTAQWSEDDISDGLFASSGIVSICADNSNPGVLYVATVTTVFAFDGTQWYQAGGGLPRWPWATDIRFAQDNSGNSYLYLATYGRGIWTANLNLPSSRGVRGV
jgi:hypothetical protein